MSKKVARSLPEINWWVWLKGNKPTTLYFLGRVTGIRSEAIQQAQNKWPQHRGHMVVQMYHSCARTLERMGLRRLL